VTGATSTHRGLHDLLAAGACLDGGLDGGGSATWPRRAAGGCLGRGRLLDRHGDTAADRSRRPRDLAAAAFLVVRLAGPARRLLGPDQAVTLGATAHAVALGVLDARRVRLRVDAQGDAKVEASLLVRPSSLASSWTLTFFATDASTFRRCSISDAG
jgi:hypothetical protein